MATEQIRCRPMTADDCALLFRWANDPTVRQTARSTAPISWETHQRWFASRLASSECRLFIAEDAQGVPLGQVRLDRAGWEAEVSITVDQAQRGKGVGQILLAHARAQARGWVSVLHAVVKPDNTASQRLFLAAHYTPCGLKDGYLTYRQDVVSGHAAASAAGRRVLFRTSGANHIGLGHLMRSLALAEAFVAAGWAVAIYGTVPPFLQARWAQAAMVPPAHDERQMMQDWSDPTFLALTAGATAVVADLYALDLPWYQRCRDQTAARLVVVTDPPLQPVLCDLMVLPTVFEGLEVAGLPSDGAPVLRAPVHCLIGSAFATRRRGAKQGQKLLISCSGGQDGGLTARFLRLLNSDPALRQVGGTVVLGVVTTEARAEVVRELSSLPGLVLREQVPDMAGLVAEHDIAFGAPAGAALERASLGVAQVLVPFVDNQLMLGQGLARAGFADVLPSSASDDELLQAMRRLLSDAGYRQAMASRAYGGMDCRGPEAVVYAIASLCSPVAEEMPDVP